MKRGIDGALVVLLGLVFLASMVLAAHTVTLSDGATIRYVDEDLSSFYNLSVNNSDPGQVANITQVNVTIPGSFTIMNSTNGTDSGNSDFVLTANVLSWNNISHYVVNGSSVNYFWFNTTAATPGNYNLTIETSNATYVVAANISVNVNDTTTPVITQIAPANATSATTSAYNFTFSVSDTSTVSNCTLNFDSVVYNRITTVSTSVTNGMYNESLDVNMHFWNVTCVDAVSNSATSSTWTLNVSAAAATTTTTTSSGGSGTDITFRPTTSKLEKGYSIGLQKNWKVKFEVDNETHTLTVGEITDTSVTVSVASEPSTATLGIGESEQFDVDEDGFYDLNVEVESLIDTNNVKLLISSINSSVVSTGDTDEEESGAGAVNNPPSAPTEDSLDSGTLVTEEGVPAAGSKKFVIIMIIIIISVVAAAYYFFFMDREGSTKKKK